MTDNEAKIREQLEVSCSSDPAVHLKRLVAVSELVPALLAELDAARERIRELEGGWITVSERLPEDDSSVLAAIPFKYTHSMLVEVVVEHCSYYEGGSGSGQKMFVTCEGEEYEHTDVTHWRPLPAPPSDPEPKQRKRVAR